MTASTVISALGIPDAARVEQRVPKKLLVENGAPTTADKREIQEGIEELTWHAALKPTTIGVPSYRDDMREYLEIAVLTLRLRTGAKAPRLRELIHRAIPYPVFLVQDQPTALDVSLAHVRWSQGQAGETVLDGAVITAALEADTPLSRELLAAIALTRQPRQNLHALYQGWIECVEAHAAARHTGAYTPALDSEAAQRRRIALADHARLSHEITSLRARAAKEKQLNRRVELNLQVKHLESRLAETANHF